MKRSSTILGILAAALLLAVASYAGIKPSANATRQEVESDTTLAVKVVGDSPGSCVLRGEADVLVGPGLVTRVETVAIEIVEIAETLNIAAGDVQVPE